MRKKERLRGKILLELRFVSCALFVHNTAGEAVSFPDILGY